MLTRLILFAFLLSSITSKAHSNLTFLKNNISFPGKNVPGVISKFYGELQYGAATLCWKLYEEGSDRRFIVERSENGTDFKELAYVTSSDGINFQYKDTLPLPTGFYRVKAISTDTIYSDIMRLSTLSGLPEIKISPALFDVVINVEINSKINESFNLVLTNSKDEIISNRSLNASIGVNKVIFDDVISFLYADEYTMTITGFQYSYSQKLYKK